jgi:predicted enzyme related to lactoylglutathione lyase
MNHFTYVEIPAVDVKKSAKFFNLLFGWKFDPMPGFDDLLTFRPEKNINGHIFKAKSIPKKPSMLLHVEVENIDEMLKKVKKLKGSVVEAKTPAGEMGWYAYFATPDGCTMALWQQKPAA